MKKMTRIATGMMALALLAGCNKSEPEAQPPETDNVGADALPEPAASPSAEPAPVAAERPEPVPAVTNAAVPVAAEPREAPPSPDAQMLDDADATGMTARLSRQEAQGNEAAATAAP